MKENLTSINDVTDAQQLEQIISAPNTLNDSLFKYMFGREESKGCLLDLLNTFLADALGHSILDLNYTNTEVVPNHTQGKKVFFDIACKLDDGSLVDIEVQTGDPAYFKNRITYYACELMSHSLKESDTYKDLKPVIVLCILDFKLFKFPEYFSSWGVCNLKNHERLSNLLSMHFIELQKLEKSGNLTKIDKWMIILSKDFSLKEKQAIAKGDVAMEKALNSVEDYFSQPNNFVAYCINEKHRRDSEFLLIDAKDLAHKEGREEGRDEMRIEVALDMLKDKLPIASIVRYSKLSLEEVQRLAKEHGLSSE